MKKSWPCSTEVEAGGLNPKFMMNTSKVKLWPKSFSYSLYTGLKRPNKLKTTRIAIDVRRGLRTGGYPQLGLRTNNF